MKVSLSERREVIWPIIKKKPPVYAINIMQDNVFIVSNYFQEVSRMGM
jgi:hypothetical protein